MSDRHYQPSIFVLVGLPASGKSTWRSRFTQERPCAVISSDDIIEEIAAEQGKTYSEVFSEAIKVSDKMARERFQAAVRERKDIVLDRTNMSVKSRASFLAGLPKDYRKRAIVFEVSEAVLNERLEKRNATGKVIPKSVIESMRASYQTPTDAEGFDTIEFVRSE